MGLLEDQFPAILETQHLNSNAFNWELYLAGIYAFIGAFASHESEKVRFLIGIDFCHYKMRLITVC